MRLKIICHIRNIFFSFSTKKRPNETLWKEEVQTEICVFESESDVKFFPLDTFPIDFVKKCAKGILDATSAEMKAEIASWKPDAPKVSKFAENLVQLDNGVKISPDPKKWKCCKCDLCENLWLNLSDGSLLCGRKNWDGSGPGSNFIQDKKSDVYFY